MRFIIKQYGRNIKKFFVNEFACIGALWTMYEVLIHFYPTYEVIFNDILCFSIFLTICINIALNLPKKVFEFYIKNQDIKIKLVIGDLLKQKGTKIVPTNTTFDTKMDNEFISIKSVQGQVQEKYFKNNINTLDKLIEQELKDNEFKELDRKNSKRKRYPIGTTVEINQLGERFYFVADSDINERGQTDNPSIENVLNSLGELWRFIGENGHVEPIIIPILGTGRMGVNKSRQDIIKNIIFLLLQIIILRKFLMN